MQTNQHTATRIVLHLYQQMNVIGQQAVRVKVKRDIRFLAPQQTLKLEQVVVRSEYPLAIIPTGNKVVKATRYFNSRLPCHGRPTISCPSVNVNISSLTPL